MVENSDVLQLVITVKPVDSSRQPAHKIKNNTGWQGNRPPLVYCARRGGFAIIVY